MINVELQESEAVGKLAEYYCIADLNKTDHVTQAINKLKLSLINSMGEVNYYQLVQCDEYLALLGVIKRRIDLVGGRLKHGYRNRLREALAKTYKDEYRYKRKIQRIWFGRGGWALKGA